jgi:hypothetical protein
MSPIIDFLKKRIKNIKKLFLFKKRKKKKKKKIKNFGGDYGPYAGWLATPFGSHPKEPRGSF